MYVIYKIEFPNNKTYIGITNCFERRRKEHERGTGKSDRKSYPVYNAIKKYGVDSLKWTILEEVEDLLTLKQKEIEYIQKFNSVVGNQGYNLTIGGDYPSTEVYKFNDEQINRLVFDLENTDLSYTQLSKKHDISITHISNITNGKYRGKNVERISSHSLKGSKNGSATLNEDTVIQIKKDLLSGLSRKSVRERYNVSKSTVQGIATGDTWSHVEPKIVQKKKPKLKLNAEIVKEIKTLFKQEKTNAELACKYHVSVQTISSIRNGLRWGSVE